MTADELALLIDLHKRQARQGPGGDAQTRLAITLSGLTPSADLRVADALGCGAPHGAAGLKQRLKNVPRQRAHDGRRYAVAE